MKGHDRQTLGRFWKVALLMFRSDARWKALGMLALIMVLALSLSGLNVVRSYVDRDFMNALAQRDRARFLVEMSRYAMLFAVMVPLAVFYRYCEERLGLFWRNWLSRYVIDSYLQKNAYYRIGIERLIDNPDQRIEEDIRSFTVSTLSFALILLNSCVALIAFVGVLWSISKVLMAGALLYALFGSVITYLLGRRLIGLNFAQLRKDADYRYKLVTVRDFSEGIAFFRGEPTEARSVKGRLADAINNMRAIIDWNRNLGFFTHSYNYVLAVLPTILVAPLYLQGKIEFGVVIQAGGAFGQVLGALSIMVVHFGTLSGLAAVATRVGSFWDTIERAHGAHDSSEGRIQRETADGVSFSNVKVLTPNRRQTILQGLSFTLGPLDRLLVTGPSGSGKSSVLRLLAGLWSEGSGVVACPAAESCMFLPQRPYMLLGSLRSQLLYGTTRDAVGQEELNRVVATAGLENTLVRVGNLDREDDWRNMLSLGEQELVAFARVFIARPRFVFLDEASNAVDEERRAVLYAELQRQGITYLSVGPRSDLERFHNRVLELDGRGGWRIFNLPREVPVP